MAEINIKHYKALRKKCKEFIKDVTSYLNEEKEQERMLKENNQMILFTSFKIPEEKYTEGRDLLVELDIYVGLLDKDSDKKNDYSDFEHEITALINELKRFLP